VSFYYTLDNCYLSREQALDAIRRKDGMRRNSRGSSRTYYTALGTLTVWVWPFEVQS